MNRVSLLSAFAMLLYVASTCQADSLVISYRSGKTQTVVLDEPSQAVSSWQFVGGAAPSDVDKGSATQTDNDEKLSERSPKKKPSVRVKWNATPITD